VFSAKTESAGIFVGGREGSPRPPLSCDTSDAQWIHGFVSVGLGACFPEQPTSISPSALQVGAHLGDQALELREPLREQRIVWLFGARRMQPRQRRCAGACGC